MTTYYLTHNTTSDFHWSTFTPTNTNHPLQLTGLIIYHENTNSITGIIKAPVVSTGTIRAYDFSDVDLRNADLDWCYVNQFSIGKNVVFERSDVAIDVDALKWISVGVDRHVTFGDGGRADLVFPAFFCADIGYRDDERLLRRIDEINDERRDWHENEPVHDVVDPNYDPYLIPREEVPGFMENLEKDYLKFSLRGGRKYFRDYIVDMVNDSGTTEPDFIKLRRGMRWIPSVFRVDMDKSVTIVSPIHNLPPISENKKIYKCISQIFELMLPGFEKLNLINENTSTDLQVIVKIQNYEIPPGVEYSGHWHMEGQTENIIASGLYYPRIDPSIVGGELKFRTTKNPGKYYRGLNKSCIVPIIEGSSVVFSNILPHRFEPITNLSDVPGNRTFISFFIVDPDAPITSTNEFLPAELFKLILEKYFLESFDMVLPTPIWDGIRKYYPNQCHSKVDIQFLRSTIRNGLSESKSGWGYVNFGNCGLSQYVPIESLYFDDEGQFDSTNSH